MKIGILTFHSQLNYGGVLQCWALKAALEGLGHEVVVVDRWFHPNNQMLKQEFATFSVKVWARFLIRGMLGCGDFGRLLRAIRTMRFVRGLNLTKEHFCDWSEIKQSNNQTIKQLDCLVVGSDQVWHSGDWGDPQPYLLEGAPVIKAISYAASFGMKEVPANQLNLYRRGLGRFSAISCREQEGVEICLRLGFAATHVVDPTLLVDPSEWQCLARYNDQIIKKSAKVLVCYFMRVDWIATLPLLEKFARKMNCHVEVLTDGSCIRPLPRSVAAGGENFWPRRVKVCRGYGPREFVRAFASATWTLTDSFHAVMFSAIFNCNARFLLPRTDGRKSMFARIDEFASACIEGDFFADDVEMALQSFERGEIMVYNQGRIAEMRVASRAWLVEKVES